MDSCRLDRQPGQGGRDCGRSHRYRVGRGAGCQDELADRSAEFETAPAGKVIRWAVERFGGSITVACSFQDCVIVDLVARVDPAIEVVFLDTGFHFPETLAFVEEVRVRYDLNLRVMTPAARGRRSWPCGTERCCELRKVEPLDRALQGRRAWITGLKRCDAPTRADAPVVAWDEARRLVKVNPVATWTDDDIDNYVADHASAGPPAGRRAATCRSAARPPPARSPPVRIPGPGVGRARARSSVACTFDGQGS